MGLNIKAHDPWKVLKAFGIGAYHCKKLKEAGVDVTVSTEAIRFSYKGDTLGKQQLFSGVLSKVMSGQLAPASHQDLASQLAATIKQVMTAVGSLKADDVGGSLVEDVAATFESAGTVFDLPAGDDIDAEAKMEAEGMAKVEAKLKAKKAPKAKTPKDIAMLLDSNPVKLAEAQLLYQPVKATSAGSVYHVVALSDDLKVAARVKGGTLSVRVEGPKVGTLKTLISETGFNHSGDYASVHLQTKGDATMNRKALGALISALDRPWQTPLPEFKYIAEAGH